MFRPLARPAFIAPVVLILVTPLWASLGSPPVAKTGAPGEGSCAECHTGSADNPGRVILDFGKLSYTPGVKQRIGVHVLASRQSGFTGFQLTARIASNELQQAGHFEVGSNLNLQVSNGIEYVHHSGGSGTLIYTLDWTPPSTNVGSIRFFAAAVAGEGNGRPDPNVYSASFTLAPAVKDLPAGYRWTSIEIAGGSNVQALGVSNNGLVVGRFQDPSVNRARAFVRDTAGNITTFQVAGSTDTIAMSVNSSGQVVGHHFDSTGAARSFFRAADGTITEVNVPGSLSTALAGINDAGVMVGAFVDGGGIAHAVTFTTPNAFQFIDIGNSRTSATGINSLGAIAGTFNNSAFVKYPDGSVMGTSMCEGGFRGTGFFIRTNDSYDIAGNCTVGVLGGNRFGQFVVAQSGRRWGFSELGASISDINNAGQVALFRDGRAHLLTPCEATPAATSISIPGSAGNATINVTSPVSDCRWLAVAGSDWITTPDNTTQGSGGYTFSFQANPVGSPRAGTFFLAGRDISVTQLAAPCEFGIIAAPAAFTAFAANGQVSVSTLPGCSWSLTSSVNWITFPEGNSGTGSGGVRFSLAANSTTQGRSGSIIAGNQQFTIVQAGAPACNYAVNPTSSIIPGSGGTFQAAVATTIGCPWSVVGSYPFINITSGLSGVASGTINFIFTANPLPTSRTATFEVAGNVITLLQSAGGAQQTALRFVPIPPCRAVDTRGAAGIGASFGPPRLAGGAAREFVLPSSGCGIPQNVRAYSLNMTAVPLGALSFLTVWPSGQDRPTVSTLNSFNGRVVANAAIVPAGPGGGINVYVTDPTDLVIDVNGYFVSPAESPSGLAFYPLAPCRIADTRPTGGKSGEFGPPSPASNTTRTLSPLTAGCNVPSSALAYSLNVTAVPPGPLSYLSLWPAGLPQPVVSTLNSVDGQVVPNAAIVPAGANGAISIFAPNPTDVVVDINGYFAPPGGAGALNFYTLPPCRVADTRIEGGRSGAFGPPIIPIQTSREFPIPQSVCGAPFTARAYSLNLTAVPPSYLGFVTLWPTGHLQPFVSTLNSWNGQVVANAAIVPVGLNGNVNVYVSNDTHMILDINGYFAPPQ